MSNCDDVRVPDVTSNGSSGREAPPLQRFDDVVEVSVKICAPFTYRLSLLLAMTKISF